MGTKPFNLQERAEAIFCHALDAILLVDDEARVVDANPAACALLGYTRDELLRLTIGDITPAPNQEQYRATWRQFIAAGQARGEYSFLRKDGTLVDVDYRAAAQISPGLHLGIMHDISARKTAEQEQARLLKEGQGLNEQLHHLARRVMAVQEEERRRIARELHDEAAQLLTAIKIILQRVEEDLPSQLADQREQLKNVTSLVDTTMDRIRMLAQDLRPPSLDTLSLNQSLAALCEEFRRRNDFFIEYTGIELPAQPDEVNVCLYRVLQEALTNVAKHAQARQVQVNLQPDANGIRLFVRDDGKGFENDQPGRLAAEAGGLGLIGMRERLQLVHGNLETKAGAGGGVQLVAWVPSVARV